MTMTMRAVVAGTALAVLSACATMAPIERPSFPLAEYEALPKEGTGAVTGQVFLRTMVGEVRYGAGSDVWLNPVTSYSTHWFQNDYSRPGTKLMPADPRQDDYIIEVQADGHGNFRFDNVPPGDYYLTSEVVWHVPLGQFSSTAQGGVISKRITVENGEEVRVMLTR